MNGITTNHTTGTPTAISKWVLKNDDILLLVLERTGLRVSEMLSIPSCQFLTQCVVLIPGSKNSYAREVDLSFIEKEYRYNFEHFLEIVKHANRYRVYRAAKRAGKTILISGNKRRSVCHGYRYRYIVDLYKKGLQLDEVRRDIGHKDIAMTAKYLLKMNFRDNSLREAITPPGRGQNNKSYKTFLSRLIGIFG